MSVETARQQVVLSVCLNSTPCLPIEGFNGAPHSLEGVLSGTQVLDEPTREWLEVMRQLVNEADKECLRTHGPSPEHAVFQPTVSLAHLRRKENVAADEVRRQRIVSILSDDDQALINLWDDEDEKAPVTMATTEQKRKNGVFHPTVLPSGVLLFLSTSLSFLNLSFSDPEMLFDASPFQAFPLTFLNPELSLNSLYLLLSHGLVPPRPPPPIPTVQMPDLSMLKELLPPEPPLHPAHSCSDLPSELNDSESATTSGQFTAPTLQPLLPVMGLARPTSARVSPQHKAQPPPPKRLPPRPPPQLPPTSIDASPQYLIDLSE